MTTIFVLWALLTGGGFAMMPLASLDACQAAMAGLPPALVAEAECVEIEMFAPSGSVYSPELAPRKPGSEA